jgi:acetate kinase
MAHHPLILVANIGSTSFKFRLYEMPTERLLARGGVDRIGSAQSAWSIRIGSEPAEEGSGHFPDYAAAVALVEEKLTGRVLASFSELAAFGFKPVMARGISGTQFFNEHVLEAMAAFSPVFPAHNPPYINAVRQLQAAYPKIPCLGLFETAFYDEVPEANRHFAIPQKWETEYGVLRTGFHGASHRFVSQRLAEIKGTNQLRLITCHLGGSSSMACVRNGMAQDSSWGMTAQSGLPHNNRVGDFDSFALLYVLETFGLSPAQAAAELSKEGGLKGLSGLDSGDLRDVFAAAEAGQPRAQLALDVLIGSIRKYLGQFLVELNGADALIFTAGIGENHPFIRSRVCADLGFCGLLLDEEKNAESRGKEALISHPDSKVEVWVLPTNEEIVIARSAFQKLQAQYS